jgi:trimethylamine--corrinoid protein Co-methyltransferase
LNAIIPALAGADELSGIGEMQAGISSSFAQMVIDDEIAASVKRLRRGFKVDADSLAVEVIAEAMDGPRNFLSQSHTRRYLRAGEIFITKLAQRSPWEEWDRSGRPGMETQAQKQAESLLARHEVQPLEKAQVNELDAIMKAAEQELVRA